MTLQGTLRQMGCSKIVGISAACNKVSLALSLNFVAELHEELAPWWPTTFILPRDIQEASETMHKKQKSCPSRTYIYKPDAS